MRELIVDFITSLDGYASADGWPGWWGLEGPEYLAWLGELPERDAPMLMGANTYRVMSGFAAADPEQFGVEEQASIEEMAKTPKVVFSSTLKGPLPWANTELVSSDAIEAVKKMKSEGEGWLRTIGSISLCRSLLKAGLVDRYRVVMFPVITGKSGQERIYDDYPDVAMEMVDARTFDGKIQLVEYIPRVLDGPPTS